MFLKSDYKVDIFDPLFVAQGILINLKNAKSQQFYNAFIELRVERPQIIGNRWDFSRKREF